MKLFYWNKAEQEWVEVFPITDNKPLWERRDLLQKFGYCTLLVKREGEADGVKVSQV